MYVPFYICASYYLGFPHGDISPKRVLLLRFFNCEPECQLCVYVVCTLRAFLTQIQILNFFFIVNNQMSLSRCRGLE